MDGVCAGEFHLLPMLRKIETPGHAALGLEAIALLRRQRASLQQHTPFSHYVGHCLMLVSTLFHRSTQA